MGRYKIAGLEGALLDAAVAKAEGWSADEVAAMMLDPNGADRYIAASTVWGIGGPIIEREQIDLNVMRLDSHRRAGRKWFAFIDLAAKDGHHGPTPLVAAMRAYVASKFGEEVELP
jgi:hypothetical protein